MQNLDGGETGCIMVCVKLANSDRGKGAWNVSFCSTV